MDTAIINKKTKNAPNIDEIFANFSKDWGGEGDAIEISEELRKSRGNTRTIEVW